MEFRCYFLNKNQAGSTKQNNKTLSQQNEKSRIYILPICFIYHESTDAK